MCRCVRDADRLDSMKPHYTINDISTQVEFKEGKVDLQCTRFKTRMRESRSQVRHIIHSIRHIISDWCIYCDGNIVYDYSTSGSRPTKARSKDA